MTRAKQKYCINILEYSSIFTLVALKFSNQCPFMHAVFYTLCLHISGDKKLSISKKWSAENLTNWTGGATHVCNILYAP